MPAPHRRRPTRPLATIAPILLVLACLARESGEAAHEATADTAPEAPEAAAPLPPRSSGYPTTAYYGDLHVHTALSADAWLMGTRAPLEDAYRYAKGEPIDHVSGTPIQARRALDFLAVTDHAEYLGLQERLLAPASASVLVDADVSAGLSQAFARLALTIRAARPHPDWVDEERARDTWRETIETADRHDAPGRFTTLVGFEWSASPEGRNLHRNVIFGPGAELPARPFSVFDSPRPEDLWSWMESQRERGVRVLAIPHNSNLSDGAMFAPVDSEGRPLDAIQAARRARNEPLVEVTQIKGTSETHPVLSPGDEFADFEIWSSKVSIDGVDPDVETAGSYVRDALRVGRAMQAAAGADPFRFGLIGSTDSHSASSPVEEDDYSGKGVQDTSARLRLETSPMIDAVQRWSASGLAAVWARANTRAEIFAALERKETFATTGPRIALRFFAGWGFDAGSLERVDWIDRAYAAGVPMGGTLPERSGRDRAPAFLVSALKDPIGAGLDRVQIVKGWSAEGETQERVYDVARAPDEGASSLSAVWTDPDFDPGAAAFYYVRVLEVPTPRWSTHDARVLGIPPPAHLPRTIQERAFSSPIWYDAPQARR